MNRFVRRFVTCLLVLALPVQGLAASTMSLCGAGHHGASEVIEGGHEHASHMHASDLEVGANDVPAASDSEGHDPAMRASASHDRSTFSPLPAEPVKGMGKCSACAACCMVAFLPTSVIAFTAQAPSHALPVIESTIRVGFFTEGPDRPPRRSLA